MLCNWCGKQVDSNSKFCPNCGKEILKEEKEVSSENLKTEEKTASQTSDNKVDEAVNETKSSDNSVVVEKANVGLAILSFFIPLAGLIIFLVKKDDEPKTAKTSGICAIVGFLLGFILSFIMTFLVINGGLRISEKVIDKSLNVVDKAIDKSDDVINDIEENKNVDISSSWSNYEFSVNGKLVKLPCTYKELKEATGFSMKTAQENSSLSNNYYTLVNMYKNDKLALYTEILNDTDSDVKYTDAKITKVGQSKYQVSTGADKLTFPGNLKAGDEITEDKIKELFGEPTDVYNYESDGYKSVTYTYNEDTTWTTTNFYEIKIVNGIIDELTLDNRNYK